MARRLDGSTGVDSTRHSRFFVSRFRRNGSARPLQFFYFLCFKELRLLPGSPSPDSRRTCNGARRENYYSRLPVFNVFPFLSFARFFQPFLSLLRAARSIFPSSERFLERKNAARNRSASDRSTPPTRPARSTHPRSPLANPALSAAEFPPLPIFLSALSFCLLSVSVILAENSPTHFSRLSASRAPTTTLQSGRFISATNLNTRRLAAPVNGRKNRVAQTSGNEVQFSARLRKTRDAASEHEPRRRFASPTFPVQRVCKGIRFRRDIRSKLEDVERDKSGPNVASCRRSRMKQKLRTRSAPSFRQEIRGFAFAVSRSFARVRSNPRRFHCCRPVAGTVDRFLRCSPNSRGFGNEESASTRSRLDFYWILSDSVFPCIRVAVPHQNQPCRRYAYVIRESNAISE